MNPSWNTAGQREPYLSDHRNQQVTCMGLLHNCFPGQASAKERMYLTLRGKTQIQQSQDSIKGLPTAVAPVTPAKKSKKGS